MVEDHQSHAVIRGGEHALDDGVGAGGQRNPDDHRRGAGIAAARLNTQPHGVVLVIGDQDVVARAEGQRIEHGLHARRGVLHQRDAIGLWCR